MEWDLDELEMNKAVYLSVYERDPATGKPWTQDKIAQRLKTTREQVNRYLQRARKEGILRTEYMPPSEDLLERILLELNYHDVTQALQLYGQRHNEVNGHRIVQSVTVVCGELPCSRQRSLDACIQEFGPYTAVKTRQFVRQVADYGSPVIGIGWGRMLRCVVDAASPIDFKGVRRRRQVQVLPLWGEALGPEVTEWKGEIFTDRNQLSCSTLARDLEAKIRGQRADHRTLSLEAVPVMLPREMADHTDVLHRYLAKVSAWGDIFGVPGAKPEQGRSSGLADDLHLVLAAAGSSAHPGRFLSPEVLKNILSDEEAEHLLRIVYGDVAGVLMEKPGLSREDRKFLDRIHASWTGVTQEHLRRCARKACDGEGVGVVVYAIEKSRAQPILEAVRRGLVTHLVIEMGLATELKRLATRGS